jgi:ATP-dependent Clp protease ATP-binding subunit ClpA
MSEILPINPFYSILIACAVVLIFFLYKKRDASSAGTSSTSTLNSFSTDFTMLAKTGRIDPVIGREDEVKKLIQVLARRNKNNVILVGSPGVGKTAIVEGLAQRIISGEVPEHLLTKRVLALDVANLMSGTKYRGEFEQRAKKIVKEIISSNRSIILFIDEIHSVIQSKGTEGAVNFTDILKPELARGDLQLVGATTTDEYNMYIKPDSSL